MGRVLDGRYGTQPPDGSVLFLIGMRINVLWKVHRWFPVFTAMPRMLRELDQRPKLGFLHGRTFMSGRVFMVVQYWESVEKLNDYARAADRLHLPAWRAFNKAIGNNGEVGVFHETFMVSDGMYETVYGNMPPTLMGAAFGMVPISELGQSAARRMKLTTTDEPAVAPPD